MTELFDEFTSEAGDLWSAYLKHPFMGGVHDGSLTSEQFTFFLVQDMPYQRDFLNALLRAAGRELDPEPLLRMRAFIADEVDFEASLLAELDVDWTFDRWTAGPSREGYMNHLTRVAHEGSLGDVCASLLPCAAGFTGAMAEPAPKAGLPPIYQRWLEFYERPEQFDFSSQLVGAFEDSMLGANSRQVHHAKLIFTRSVQHQIAVLDAAYGASDAW